MHQYKTIAQTILVLSVLNLVSAAPVAPREARDTDNDVVVAAGDVTTVSKRRRDGDTPPGGTTPSQYSSSSSSGETSPHGSSPLEESPLLQGSAPSSHLWATDGQVPVPVHDSITQESTRMPASTHPLSLAAADGGPAPAPVSNTEESTSSHHSSESATDRPVPVPASVPDSTAEGSTTPHYSPVTLDMLSNDPPSNNFFNAETAKKAAGLTLMTGVAAAVVFFAVWQNRNGDDSAPWQ
jgi:hypothetical protein